MSSLWGGVDEDVDGHEGLEVTEDVNNAGVGIVTDDVSRDVIPLL